MTLQLGKSAMMRLPEPLLHRSVGNPDVVQAMLVAPDTLYLAGIDVGSTNMIIQGKSGACSVVDIVVDDGSGGLCRPAWRRCCRTKKTSASPPPPIRWC